MGILNYMDLKEKAIVSIVGAGGKTSLLFQLGKELKKNHKVLLTTTTKIYVPQSHQYDFICTDENEFLKVAKKNEKGIYVYGERVNAENKLTGLKEGQLDPLVNDFNYIFIEADGAKKKQIKGWNETEPVVYGKTTKTIGILDIQALGLKVCERNVHRSEAFCKMTQLKEGENITLEALLKIIVHPEGLFKNAKGEKILFINKADELYNLDKAEQLKNEMNKFYPKFLSKMIIGSIKNNLYFY
ncbi:selenium cofactor biosynthesis protein YqeC [Crassaminicella profunda]|uniref:selenium cofactor biosynthesis protein YqeC n=1 Tax=Crassaminicella profunda TaxID=1286698 RepID=UPI001CA710AF|nr:selenium cofactor biosynthesis protein YqeC [Crassaminicella profunda]QZY54048.1 putative selenium-dependent hydroxylase accessory protein YqeC [Crassaminicella profunda]